MLGRGSGRAGMLGRGRGRSRMLGTGMRGKAGIMRREKEGKSRHFEEGHARVGEQ